MHVRQNKSCQGQEFSIAGGRLSWQKTVKCKDFDSKKAKKKTKTKKKKKTSKNKIAEYEEFIQ